MMKTSMKALGIPFLFLASLLGSGCEEGPTESESRTADEVPEVAPPAASEATSQDVAAVELERVLRRVERGQGTAADADVLARLLDEAKLPSAALDRASLGLSRVLEERGDAEGAIRAVEDLMKRHVDGAGFEAADAAHARLRLLVSGAEEPPPSSAINMEPMAPVAKALAKYFAEDDRGAVLADVLLVGRAPNSTDPHGIFNFRAAKRQIAEAACAVCEVDVRVQRSQTRVDSWVDLLLHAGPRVDMPNPDRSLVVVYFDLEQNRVPSRYDRYLALPSEETVERLERGEAFVAFRERPGKKPLVLLAAPRVGQLDAVETAFAQMNALPTEPARVDVQKRLLPGEIQGVVRSAFRTFRTCYEKLLATDPKAAGQIVLDFGIDAEGKPTAVSTTSTFADAGIATCVADHVAKVRFPAGGEVKKVTYPIAFSP